MNGERNRRVANAVFVSALVISVCVTFIDGEKRDGQTDKRATSKLDHGQLDKRENKKWYKKSKRNDKRKVRQMIKRKEREMNKRKVEEIKFV